MPTISVVNIKCGGCARRITEKLEAAGCTDVAVDVAAQAVTFAGAEQRAEEALLSLGYPRVGTPAAESFIKKAQSFVSCAVGKLS